MKNNINELESKIVESLEKDSISRNNSLCNFIKLLSKINNNEIIAINGGWGTGKTIFAKQMELLVNFANNTNEDGEYINEELKTNNLISINDLTTSEKEIINKLLKSKEMRSFFDGNQTNCLYFNAWEYDNNESPILSIIYKLINDFPYLSSKFVEEKKDLFLSITDTISTNLTNGFVKISDYHNSKDLVEQIVTSEELKEKVNQIFENILTENSNKMILIIDELDRCKPTYAIKLLEEIKHYITNENIIIVLTTNIYQLSNTIKKIYGYNFDVDEYLDKIIDLTISLKPIDKNQYVKSLGLDNFENKSHWFSEVTMAYIHYRKLEMRSINRFIRLMSFYENHMISSSYRRKKTRYLFEYVFLPYCLGEQIFNSSNYNDFIKGTGYNEFYKYISSDEKIKDIIEQCIFHSTRKEERNIELELKKLYDSIYNSSEEYISVKIGNEEIETYDIKYFLELCSMLNDFNLSE